jgi:uncharacterized membrane protein YphA (DoxX/SURF4 family)
MAWLTIWVEILGGLAVLLGAFVVLVSLPMAAVLLTAMFTVHLRYGFSSIKILAILASRLAFELPRAPADSQLTLFAPFVLFVAIPVFGSAVLYAAGNAATGNTLSTGALAN